MTAKYYQKKKKMLQKRKKQETSICSQTIQKVFIENDGNRQYARNLYNNLFEKKKKAKDVSMHAKNIDTFPKKKKTKSVNILGNDIEFFLKSFNFLCIYKSYIHLKSSIFSGKRKKVF